MLSRSRTLGLGPLLAALALSCSGPATTAFEATRVGKGYSPDLNTGTYRIEGRPTADGCGGQVYLAARHITIDVAERTLRADVVNRTYALRFDGGAIVADGAFDESADCAGPDVRERWTLRPAGEGRLRGELESSWSLAPDCASRCTITFGLTAVRGN